MRWIPDLRAHLYLPEGVRSSDAIIGNLLHANTVGHWVGSSVCSAEHTLLQANTITTLRQRSIAAVGTYTLFPLDTRTVKTATAQARHPESEEEIERMLALGVDWIETDDPERVLERVGLPVFGV